MAENTENTDNKKIALNLDFEQIIPWNGKQDTGRDVRLKLDRNWQKVTDAFNTILEFMVTGDYLESQYLRKDRDDATPYRLGVGSLSFQDKPINRFIRYYDEDKPEEVSDADFYSALMVDERIKEGAKELDERYLRKDKEDTAHKHITFEEGITVYELAKMMNLEVEQLATIAKAIVKVIGSSTFVDGFFGEGWQIWKAIATEDWNFTIDRLTVRKVMTVYELIIQKIRSVGGMVVVSAANGKIKEVEQAGLEYKFTFEDTNMFCEYDLMRCQVWTGTGTKYYWVEVVRVEGEEVYTRVADFGGVIPEPGDEVVLMGNTRNKLRQNLILISATEDGQPRFDCLDGVKTKNFDGCLRTRVGCLDGITDDRFPSDMQPKGYGLYADNCFLTGVFVLSNGNDVQTQFAILEGMIRTSIASVQQQINAEDNYLSNASFTSNMESWNFFNDVRVFRTSGGLLHFNGNFYSIKNAVAGIVPKDTMNVLRLKNSYIKQLNDDFAMHPEFDLVEQIRTDADGNEVNTGVKLYRPRMFFVSFKYMVLKRGTLRVRFENEMGGTDFESYTPIVHEEVLETSSSFEVKEIAGKWNGTGDFLLSFDGDIYIYDLALADNKLADMEERWSMQLEVTDKKIQANAEHIKQQGENLEEYRSEFLFTAEELRTEFTALVQNKEEDITEAYIGLVELTAERLTSDYTAKIADYYGTVTEEYQSKIEQTAGSIRTEVNGRIDDVENGIRADMGSSFTQLANQIELKVSQTDYDLLEGIVSNHETRITQNTNSIEAVANSIETDAWGNITNISTSGLVLDSEFASLFSTQVNSQGVAKTAQLSAYVLESELGSLVSKIEISADQIDLTGKVTFNALHDDVVSEIDGKATQDDIDDSIYWLEYSLGSLAYRDSISASSGYITGLGDLAFKSMIGKSLLDDTVIQGGYIRTSLIDASALRIGGSQVTGLGDLAYQDGVNASDVSGLGSLAYLDSIKASDVSGLGSLAVYDNVLDAMEDETIMVGGYIKTSLIDVDDLEAKRIVTDSDSYGYKVDIQNGHIWMKDNDNNVVVQVNASSYVPAVWLTDSSGNSCGMNSKGFFHTPASGGMVQITNGKISLSSGAAIEGMAIKNINDGYLYGTSDFSIVSSGKTLPSSKLYPGKIIFVKCSVSSGNVTISASSGDKIVGWSSKKSDAASSVTSSGSSAMFFISDGLGYWYGFVCH